MDIEGRNVLVLGGAGLVGTAVSRELLAAGAARIVVAGRRERTARETVTRLRDAHPAAATRIVPTWGDVFLRAAWQETEVPTRGAVLADPERRRRLVADILDPLDDEMADASLLVRMITGAIPGLDGIAADVVVDCINSATVVSYQNVYATAARLRALAAEPAADTDWPAEVECLLTGLYVPQLVRHVQLLYEGMRRAGTRGYAKVGTSGSGGYGFNIPYTHGEEHPSRLLLCKSAVAGAQTLLDFLMARTPDGPRVVKHVTPAACIGWREIGYGPIHRHGATLERFDCTPEHAVSAVDPASLAARGDFGTRVDRVLEAVYIDTGENGVFSADEFVALTAPGQMQLVTAEEIAVNVVRELRGVGTGRDVVAALDSAVMGPSYRGGHLRHAAIERLRRLEAEHGAGVAFEILGPPRLTKLLFEAHLLARTCATIGAALARPRAALAAALEAQVLGDADLRERILAAGIAILLGDGERLLRGPTLKAASAEDGWVDLRPDNVALWQARLAAARERLDAEREDGASSRSDRVFSTSGYEEEEYPIVPGEIVAHLFGLEGRRDKT